MRRPAEQERPLAEPAGKARLPERGAQGLLPGKKEEERRPLLRLGREPVKEEKPKLVEGIKLFAAARRKYYPEEAL